MMPADFKETYPVFNDVENSTIEKLLEDAKKMINEKIFSQKYTKAIFLLVAHALEIEELRKDDLDEAVVSRSTEAGSVSIVNPSKDFRELFYSKTSYGVEYLALRRSIRKVGYVLDGSIYE